MSGTNSSKIALLMTAIFGGFIIMCATIYFGLSVYYHDKSVAYEESIVTLSQSSESLLSNGTMTILDKAKLKDSYAADFKESLRIAIDGRYGNDQGVAMKWIQENTPSLSTALYTDISSYIEGMRRDFKISQDRIIDQCRSYRVLQRSAFSGMFVKGDFPSEDFDQDNLCAVVSDAKTKKAFETKQQTSIL